MNDFYKLLKQSIIDRGLDTPEARQAAYAQARRAMINRLWSYKPPLEEREIDHRVEQFDKAVIRIEDDVAEAFAAMAAEPDDAPVEPRDDDDAGDGDIEIRAESDEDESGATEDFDSLSGGENGEEEEQEEDEEDGEEEEPPRTSSPAIPAPTLDERSLAVERALMGALDEPPPSRPLAPHDEDLAVWADAETDSDDLLPEESADHDVDAGATDAPVATADEQLPLVDDAGEIAASEAEDSSDRPSFIDTMRTRLTDAMPKGEQAQVRTLVAAVAILGVILAGGIAWALIPGGTANVAPQPVVGAAEAPPPDPNGPIRLPREAIAVTSGFSLFDGHDPTVFSGAPNNPVRYDGELARIASSTGSSGAKVIIGAGLSNRLAGQTVRVVLDARSARENGATSMRFAYESGVALSHWQTANLGKDFSELSLVWRVPTMRTNPQGDYIVIEPGIPGSGTGVEIRSVRIELANS